MRTHRIHGLFLVLALLVTTSNGEASRTVYCRATVVIKGAVAHAKDLIPIPSSPVNVAITGIGDGVNSQSFNLSSNSNGNYGATRYLQGYDWYHADRQKACTGTLIVKVCSREDDYLRSCVQKDTRISDDSVYVQITLPKLKLFRPGECLKDDAYFTTEETGCVDLTSQYSWSAAKTARFAHIESYCADLPPDNLGSWRVASRQELVTLKGANGAKTHLNLNSAHWYRTFERVPDKIGQSYLVRLSDGRVTPGKDSGNYYTICVRNR